MLFLCLPSNVYDTSIEWTDYVMFTSMVVAEKLFPTFVFKTNIKSIKKKEYVFVSINNLQRVFYLMLIHSNQFLKARNIAHLRAFLFQSASFNGIAESGYTNKLSDGDILKMYKVKPIICVPLDYM